MRCYREGSEAVVTNDELLDSAEGDLSDAKWAIRQLTERLPMHCTPGRMETDVGRLLANLAQLRREIWPENSGSERSERIYP